MENAVYDAIVSANQLLEKQTIIANNLANISTTGFKEKFNYILEKNNTENKQYAYNKIIKEYYNVSPGILNYTQRNLDLFVEQDGWFVVKDMNGEEAYTKNGHLKINSNGKLTIQNHEVMGKHCDINIPNNAQLKISSDGIISSILKKRHNSIENKIGELKLVKIPIKNLIQKENGFFYLNKKHDNFYHKNRLIPHDNNVRIKSGALELSNVNAAQNMIEMISNARQFETQMKIISISDKNAEYANQLININN
jgi:flagellar basal-body rod protein FlgF